MVATMPIQELNANGIPSHKALEEFLYKMEARMKFIPNPGALRQTAPSPFKDAEFPKDYLKDAIFGENQQIGKLVGFDGHFYLGHNGLKSHICKIRKEQQ